jgi:hypothetical protein
LHTLCILADIYGVTKAYTFIDTDVVEGEDFYLSNYISHPDKIEHTTIGEDSIEELRVGRLISEAVS